MKIIDSHIHCGIQNVEQPIALIQRRLVEAGIDGACLFAPVEDVYDRYERNFEDTEEWQLCRHRANRYLLDAQHVHLGLNAYYFVWNDFRADELARGYRGVKWHRHEDEPEYEYGEPECEAFLSVVYRLELPIVLEESYQNTLDLIERINGRTVVIIPHLGFLNGGFRALLQAGVWERETVYADTSLASRSEMLEFIERFGGHRLLFGSDFPFGTPRTELAKVRELGLSDAEFQAIVGGNIRRLLKL